VRALVDTAWLAGELQSSSASATLRVADVRWYLDPARIGRDAFRAGHIPGAVFVDLERELAAPGGGRGLPPGRHPWPSEELFAGAMSRAGIGPGVRVVAYDDASGSVAARLWYLLRAHVVRCGASNVHQDRIAVVGSTGVLHGPVQVDVLSEIACGGVVGRAAAQYRPRHARRTAGDDAGGVDCAADSRQHCDCCAALPFVRH
jgi:hypothetical protein